MRGDEDHQMRLLETYEHTGKRLHQLGMGLLVVLGIPAVTGAIATIYAIRHPNPPVPLLLGPIGLGWLFFATSSVVKSIGRILEVRNCNPAVTGETAVENDAHKQRQLPQQLTRRLVKVDDGGDPADGTPARWQVTDPAPVDSDVALPGQTADDDGSPEQAADQPQGQGAAARAVRSGSTWPAFNAAEALDLKSG
jgi:hypothetical protein